MSVNVRKISTQTVRQTIEIPYSEWETILEDHFAKKLGLKKGKYKVSSNLYESSGEVTIVFETESSMEVETKEVDL